MSEIAVETLLRMVMVIRAATATNPIYIDAVMFPEQFPETYRDISKGPQFRVERDGNFMAKTMDSLFETVEKIQKAIDEQFDIHITHWADNYWQVTFDDLRELDPAKGESPDMKEAFFFALHDLAVNIMEHRKAEKQ